MASLTQSTWVWANSGSWWWTGSPGVLQSMVSQSIRHDWVTELNLNWTKETLSCNFSVHKKGAIVVAAAAAAAKSLQSCLTLCDPVDGSPPGSPVPGILQARTLEWVAISFSNAWKWEVKVKLLSRVWLLATPWTAAHQAPPSMGFSRQEYWSGVPLPSPSLLGYCCYCCLFPLSSHFDRVSKQKTIQMVAIAKQEGLTPPDSICRLEMYKCLGRWVSGIKLLVGFHGNAHA